jgi:hypothetical protein
MSSKRRSLTRESWERFARRNKLTYSEADRGWRWLAGRNKNLREGLGPASYGGYYAPTVAGVKTAVRQDAAFPFGTEAAARVWSCAREVEISYPEASADEILSIAMRDADVVQNDLTPEDAQLLRMAMDWLMNGPAQSTNRTGGAPGGPFRAAGPGYMGRGAK